MSSNKSYHSTGASSEEFWCNTELDKANYVWTIDNFTSRQQDTYSTIESPSFSASTNGEYEWNLELEFRDDHDGSDFLSILAHYNTTKIIKNHELLTKSFFSILNGEQEEIYTSSIEYNILNNNTYHDSYFASWGWSNCFENDETFRSNFLQNDALTISFQLIFFEMNCENFARMFCQCNDTTRFSRFRQLSVDLTSAFENHAFSDFTLSIKGKDYQVHKVILAARSNYFAKMFESGMKEIKENRVEIIDVNEDIMDEMLKFIYTGKCENLDKLADDLLIAADRYDMVDLKRICVESIYRKSLSVDNALKVLILADQCDADNLKSAVISFIIDKQSKITNLPTWDSTITMYPQLLNELCKAALSRTSKK